MFVDDWPSITWSVLDYYRRPKRGYAAQMVLSQDASCFFDWIDPAFAGVMPNWHYLHITNDVLPALGKLGVTDEEIDEMLVVNPRRYFENVETY